MVHLILSKFSSLSTAGDPSPQPTEEPLVSSVWDNYVPLGFLLYKMGIITGLLKRLTERVLCLPRGTGQINANLDYHHSSTQVIVSSSEPGVCLSETHSTCHRLPGTRQDFPALRGQLLEIGLYSLRWWESLWFKGVLKPEPKSGLCQFLTNVFTDLFCHHQMDTAHSSQQ